MKYKILFVNLFPEIGGAETSLIYLINTLDRKKFTPFVIVPQPGMFSRRLEKISKVIYLKLPGYTIRTLFIPGFSLPALIRFIRLCRRIKPDLIHLNHITLAFYTGFARHFLNIPVIARSWMNSDCVYFFQNIVSNFGCTLVLPITLELQNLILLKGFIPKNKIRTVNPGIDTGFFCPPKSKNSAKKRLGINPHHLTVSIVSRFDPVKDHLTFLRAMDIVIKLVPKITILIVQDTQKNLDAETNYAPQVKKQIDSFLKIHPLLNKKVIFTGYKSSMLPVYQATDILVSSSLYESLGISLLEAASCALPIVTTSAGTQKLVVRNNQNGFLVPIQNPLKMAEKILVLLRSKNLRIIFGQNGRQHVMNNFSINDYANKMQQTYLLLIKYLCVINEKLRHKKLLLFFINFGISVFGDFGFFDNSMFLEN